MRSTKLSPRKSLLFKKPLWIKKPLLALVLKKHGVKFLMKKNAIEVYEGCGVLQGEGRVLVQGEKETTLAADNILLALGAHPRSLPGVVPDGEKVITSREALVLQHRPASIVIVGGGAIGMEFAYLLSAFGTEVTVVELLDQILPHEDSEVAAELSKIYKKRGVRLLTSTAVEAVDPEIDREVSEEAAEERRYQYQLVELIDREATHGGSETEEKE